MAKKPFKYDLIQLIENVRDRPCIWDKSLETYKDRIERRHAWEEIFHDLEEGYEEMSWEDKKTTGEIIINKWTNLRDTFVKTLRHRMGRQKKKYVYHKYLSFLTKDSPAPEGGTEGTSDMAEYYAETSTSFKQEPEEQPSFSKRKKRKVEYDEEYVPRKLSRARKTSDDSDYNTYEAPEDKIDFVEVESPEPVSRLMNEDEAFFASLLPTVVKYDEDDKLTFRIEVLAVMKRIKDKTWHGVDLE